MIIDLNKERRIYVPTLRERAELEKEINKLPLDDMAEQYAPYLAFAKKYKLYTIDSKGRQVYPYEISKVFSNSKGKTWQTLLEHRGGSPARIQYFLPIRTSIRPRLSQPLYSRDFFRTAQGDSTAVISNSFQRLPKDGDSRWTSQRGSDANCAPMPPKPVSVHPSAKESTQ